MKNKLTKNLKQLIELYGLDSAMIAINEMLDKIETINELSNRISDELYYAMTNGD